MVDWQRFSHLQYKADIQYFHNISSQHLLTIYFNQYQPTKPSTLLLNTSPYHNTI